MKTSVSDYSEYRNICNLAATHEEAFQSFRQHPHYTPILEHCDYEQGKLYAEWSLRNKNFSIEKLNLAKQNDLIGGPNIVDYPFPIGRISPSTLRYFKVMLELETLFGNLSDKNIIEVGVGYGGQCKMINNVYSPKSYTLVDLPEPLSLSKRFNQDESLSFKTMETLSNDTTYDLMISNYAFSECSKEIQLTYIEKIIKKSKNGYITFNNISNLFSVSSFSKQELNNFFKFKEIEEYPVTRFDNSILVW